MRCWRRPVGYFLRAETMHGLFSYLESNPGAPEPDFHGLSHGESFLAMLSTRRFDDPGFFVLDEPEGAVLHGCSSRWSDSSPS